jgi:L,D-transpeptidase catalytic domain
MNSGPRTLGTRAALVATLVLVLVGAPVAADDTTTTTIESTTTTVEPTSTITSTITSTTDSSSGPASTADTTSTIGSTTEPTTSTAVEAVPGSTPPPVGTLVLNSGASASPAVPITGPAAASGVTPRRGSQVQLQAPPPPPPPEFQLPPNSGSGRRAVYSKSLQRVWAVDENEVVIKTHRVSGRLDPLDPRPGTYSVYSRSFSTFAIHNPSITWNYMIRFAHGSQDGNIGFHAIPYQYGRPVQTIEQLGQPLSGGCVRQAPEDAIWMWNWAHVGTVVVVLA